LIGMTNTLSLELARHGITVNAIGPGPIYSDLFARLNPLGSQAEQQFFASVPAERFGQPADVAHAVASLIDPRAGYITGQTLYVCGGTSLGYQYTAV
jgi:3-oxoacyl-[acyl-carrier protein] reductase